MLETNQQEAMKLIEEKQKLQREIEGKEPSLVEDKKQRIVDIDNEMKQLVEDDAKGEIRITAKGLDQVPTEFRDRARNIGTLKKGLFGKTQDVYAYTLTRDEYTKLKENAVQERSTEEVLPREQEQAGETGGQREGMGQSLEGQEVTQEGVTEENPLSNVESTSRALNSDLVKQIQDESGELFPLTTEQDLDYFTNLSERYHKAKQDGTNPELVNAFEKVLGPKQPTVETEITKVTKLDNGNIEYNGEEFTAEPTVKKNKNGEVDRVILTAPDGARKVTLRGQEAIDFVAESEATANTKPTITIAGEQVISDTESNPFMEKSPKDERVKQISSNFGKIVAQLEKKGIIKKVCE
jgi:hypothetical protein